MESGLFLVCSVRATLGGIGLLMALAMCPSPVAAQATPLPAPPASQTANAASATGTGDKKVEQLQPAKTPLPRVENLTVAVEPAGAAVDYKDDKVELSLVLGNLASAERIFRVDLGALSIKGSATARVRFHKDDDAEWLEVSVPAGKAKRLPFRVEGMTHLGTYDGQVRVGTVPLSQTETVLPVQVVRNAPGFELTTSAPEMVDGVLTLKPKSELDNTFSFIVENAKTAGNANLRIEVTAQPGGTMVPIFGPQRPPARLTVTQPSLVLLPGNSATVQLVLSNPPPSGEHLARVTLTDTVKGTTKHLNVRLQPAFVPRRDWAVIIVLVALGAFLSILVGAAIPNLVARTQLWRRLDAMRTAINALPADEQLSKAVLMRQLKRVDAVVRDASWYTPTAAVRLEDEGKKAAELERRVELLAEVSGQRLLTQTSPGILSSARAGLFAALDSVAEAVTKASVDEAATSLALARTAIGTQLTATTVLAVLGSAIRDIEAAMKRPRHADVGPYNQGMSDRFAKLQADNTRVNAAVAASVMPSTDELLRLDYECECAKLYFLKYRGEVLDKHGTGSEINQAEAAVVKLLSLDSFALIEAAALIDSLQLGVTPNMLDAALASLDKSASVVVIPGRPKEGEVATFRLEFKDDLLNRTPLLRNILFRWEFDTGVPEAIGPKVGQFIPTTLFTQRFWERLAEFGPARKFYRWLYKRTPNQIGYRLVVGPVSLKRELEGSLQFSRQGIWERWSLRAEFLSFLVALVVAIAAALLSKYAETKPLESLQDYLNPFLLGFSFDRIKALIGARSTA